MLPARALGASDGLLLIHHDALVAHSAVIANIFVYGHSQPRFEIVSKPATEKPADAEAKPASRPEKTTAPAGAEAVGQIYRRGEN